jgi:sugar lactone lactonase YvrE
VIEISIAEGKALRAIPIAGSQRLNDMASDGSDVFVSDTVRGLVIRVDLGDQAEHEVVAELEAVNGICFHNGRMFAVSWGLHDIYEIDYRGGGKPKSFDLAEHFSNLDGIEVLGDGSFIVSDYTGGKISRIGVNRASVTRIAVLDTPADFGLDASHTTLFVPQLSVSKLSVFKLD